MRIFFFTLVKMTSINDSGIYADMVKEFIKKGNQVDYYFPSDKHFCQTGNNFSLNSILINQKVQKTNNFLLKFIAYLLIDYKLSRVIKKSTEKFDLLILATPSIFQLRIIRNFKSKNKNSKILLLLKDIFPDNAMDLGLLENKFPKSIIYKYFKLIEKRLYSLVDKIGVMTKYNKEYIESNHQDIKSKLFISPNSIYPYVIPKLKSRKDLNLPNNILITFVGNIGLPQDPIFLRNLINSSPENITYLIIGTGSKAYLLKDVPNEKVIFINENLNKEVLDQYLINSDFGLITLNSNFKVPNFPSKLLSYLNANLPIIAFTNYYNDLKELISNGSVFGYWGYSGNLKESIQLIETLKATKVRKIHTIFDEYNVSKQIDLITETLSI